MHSRFNKTTAFITAIVFAATQVGTSPSGWANVRPMAATEVKVPNAFRLELPPDLGTVETLVSGSGPTILHIQEAHGNSEAQKKIQAILHYLKDTYDVKLVLLEGSAFKLHPELLRFNPGVPLYDELVQQGIVSGPELFLAREGDASGYGIEDLKAYANNGASFKEVLTQRSKAGTFLADMDKQIKRLVNPYLNSTLRHFLGRLEDYDAKVVSLADWLSYMKGLAKEHLSIDLENPVDQIDWPMLVRIFTLRGLEKRLDLNAYEREKKEFLKAIQRFVGLPSYPIRGGAGAGQSAVGTASGLYDQIESLLSQPLSQNRLPDPETGLLFEEMISRLGLHFNYRAYPNVNLFIGHLILQSELRGEGLIKEMERLVELVTAKLARTGEEKQIAELLKDYRLLGRLFRLELTPADYEEIAARENSNLNDLQRMQPSAVIRRFLAINDGKRVKNAAFKHIHEIDALYTKALEFYRGAKERDQWMLENIEKRLRETGATKAVVITGGFHTEPFKKYLAEHHYNYALITPRLTTVEGHERYVESILASYVNPSSLVWSTMKDIPRAATLLGEAALLGRVLFGDHARVAAGLSRHGIPASAMNRMAMFRPYDGIQVTPRRRDGREGCEVVLGVNLRRPLHFWVGSDGVRALEDYDWAEILSEQFADEL
ncbi:MAG: hypothetical protein NC930_09745, partial [Candidatus Omnitrophica bacterium]|nr:hypothetical protein [Candidatus Omnitrophota bacterium]